ncbi:MAG: hypothetical protein L6437_05520, partial [Kiritimatiellae bacterium]|nr:hypothetical protein [Verrucomicrobiota bacterium]MCG2659686.1 hypothetical protein [Kiritimatiellia bacterium]
AKTLMFAGKDGRVILAHLLCCAGLAVCLYSGTPRAHAKRVASVHPCPAPSGMRQTDAMQDSGINN